jgi:L-fuconolactonase
MTIIDSHVHFWKYDPVTYNWIDDSMQILRQDFLPEHIESVYKQNSVNGCVAVEAHQSANETLRLLRYATQNTFIKGVVGYVNLLEQNIDEQLQQLSSHEKLKGFRMALQSEAPNYMLQPAFLNGISKLQPFNFTYDLLILPQHLDAALQLVSMFPQQRFVIDHMGKPFIKDKQLNGWKQGIEALSKFSNVYCKISGMVTEADWNSWTNSDLKPYLDVVTGCFGNERIMYGSDWPVCLVAASYERWLQTLLDYFNDHNNLERENFFSKNAAQFYNL